MNKKKREQHRIKNRRRLRKWLIIAGALFLLLFRGLATLNSRTEFSPVTIDGFEVFITFNHIFDQGEHTLDANELAELLPNLSYDVQTHLDRYINQDGQVQNFTFYLELMDVQLTQDIPNNELAEGEWPLPETVSVTVDAEGKANFEDITFYHAGIFTYRIYQSFTSISSESDFDRWNPDESYFYITVIVTEDEEDGVLRAHIEEQETLVFTNELIIDIQEQITSALAALRPQQFSEMQDDLEIMLQEMVATRGGDQIGISYLCLTTGRQISINGDQFFNAASTSKLPTHMMVADDVHHGRITWNSSVTFTSADYESGTGILQHSIQVGDAITASQLLELSITHSDNIAHHMLARGFTGQGQARRNAFFSRYLPGQTPPTNNSLTTDQLMTLLQILYEGRYHIEGYEIIIEHMSNTTWNDRLYTDMTADHLSHIIGTFYGYTHDAGIFHLEHPYILVVMTNGIGTSFISDVSDAVFALHYAFQ